MGSHLVKLDGQLRNIRKVLYYLKLLGRCDHGVMFLVKNKPGPQTTKLDLRVSEVTWRLTLV